MYSLDNPVFYQKMLADYPKHIKTPEQMAEYMRKANEEAMAWEEAREQSASSKKREGDP